MQAEVQKKYKVIGNNIHRFRILQHMTQEKLAEIACISVAYISKIERADLNQGFSCTTIMKISAALNIPVCVLMNEEPCQIYMDHLIVAGSEK